MVYGPAQPMSFVTTSRRILFASVLGSAKATRRWIEWRLKIYNASLVLNSPVMGSPSFVSTSIVIAPAAPVAVQSSGSPSAEPCIRLFALAEAIQTREFHTAMYLPLGGLPPSAAAVLVLSTFTGFVPLVAPFTPTANPPNVIHCQKVLFGNVSAPVRFVSPVPFVSII